MAKKGKKPQKQLPMSPPPLSSPSGISAAGSNDGAPLSGVDAVSEVSPMLKPDSALGSIGATPPNIAEPDQETAHFQNSIASHNPPAGTHPDLERFWRQQNQPDHEPIMNALGMLHMIGNAFLPRSQLPSAAPTAQEQAPQLWQRPPLQPEQPPLGMGGRAEGSLTRATPTIPGMSGDSSIMQPPSLASSLPNQTELGAPAQPNLFQRPPIQPQQNSALPFPVSPQNQPNMFGAEMPMSAQSDVSFGAPSGSNFIESNMGGGGNTQNMRPPSLPDTQISNTAIQPSPMSDPNMTALGQTAPQPNQMPPTQTMQAPQMPAAPPDAMQQGNSQMLKLFDNMTPEQQLQVLISALGLGAGAGAGFGYESSMNPPALPPQQPQWYGEALPPPKATQR